MLALDSLFGLPAHIFLVHIPVVLIPLGALGAVLMLWPRLRSAIGWWVCGILVVAGIATQLAITSGKSLRDYVHETSLVREHTRIGENIRPWLLFLFLALLGVMLIDAAVRRRAERPEGRGRLLQIAGIVLSALSIVFAAMSVYWVYRIGHSGSKAVWHSTQVKIDRGQSHHEGGETREGDERRLGTASVLVRVRAASGRPSPGRPRPSCGGAPRGHAVEQRRRRKRRLVRWWRGTRRRGSPHVGGVAGARPRRCEASDARGRSRRTSRPR